MDFLLGEAFQIHEDEHSTSHGLPLYLTRSLDPNLIAVVEERIDIADAALQDYDEKQSKKKKKAKGVSRYVTLTMADGSSVPEGGLAREAFYMQEMENAELLSSQEGLDIERERPEKGYNPADYGDGM